MTLEHLLFLLIGLYLLQITWFLYALRNPRDIVDQSLRPFVTVIIAARNEEGNLETCLNSVLNQSYSGECYEVIVVNDNSTDRTEDICRDFASRFGQMRYLNASHGGPLRGKTNALDQGIENARGEVILFTDADCVVPTTWIEWTAYRYTEKVGIIGGMTIQRAQTWFSGMQSLDWAFLLGLAASTVSLRIPLSTIGNNLSFRKCAYEEVGGYKKLPFSVTEDFVLFQAIVGTKRWDYLCPIDPRVLVVSQPCATWKELIRQKHRWGTGGLDMNLSGMLVMAVGFGLNTLMLLNCFFGSLEIVLGVWGLKMAGEYAFLNTIMRKQQRLDVLRHFFWFEGYFVLYVLLLPFLVFLGGPVVWKGRTY